MHDGPSVDAVAVGHELALRGRRVDQQDIGVTPAAQRQRFAGSDRQDADAIAGMRPLERGNQDVEQPGVLGGGRGGQNDLPGLGRAARQAQERGAEDGPQ